MDVSGDVSYGFNASAAAAAHVDIFESLSEQQRLQLQGYRVFAYCVGCLIILSNLVVVISSGLILKRGSHCKSTFLLLGNVSLADTIIGANVLFGVSVRHDAVSHAMCFFQIGLVISPTLVSIYSVGLIALDRYVFILHGLHYRRWINTTRVRLCILISWFLGLSVGLLPAIGWSGDTLGGRKCWYVTIAPPSLVLFITAVGLLPILAVCVLYSIILFHALKNVTQLRQKRAQAQRMHEADLKFHQVRCFDSQMSLHTISASIESIIPEKTVLSESKLQNTLKRLKLSMSKKTQEPNKWRAIKVVLLTSGSIVVTWVPYFLTTIVYVMCDKKVDDERCLQVEGALASPLALLGLLNSLLNPMIYAWWHRGFKSALGKILCGFGHSRSSAKTKD